MAGENCTLSYNSGKSAYELKCRVRGVAHSTNIIATESHARQFRAMYPHQRAPGQFGMTVELKGYTEYRKFMEFFWTYYDITLNGNPAFTPRMTVNVASKDFSFMRVGVPVSGVSDGDRVGSMLFTENIIFETVIDPLDPRTYDEQVGAANRSEFVFGDNYTKDNLDDPMKFFYPASPGSQDPNVRAEDIYNPRQFLGQPTQTLPQPGVAPGFGSPELLGN